MNKEELIQKIGELRGQSLALYGQRIDLERELTAILAREFLESGLLKTCTFTLTSARHLEISDVPDGALNKFFVDGGEDSGNYLKLGGGIELYANFDDEDYAIHAESNELLVEFIAEYGIKIHLQVKDRLLKLQTEIEHLQMLVNIYS